MLDMEIEHSDEIARTATILSCGLWPMAKQFIRDSFLVNPTINENVMGETGILNIFILKISFETLSIPADFQ